MEKTEQELLEKAEEALTEHAREIVADWNKPLTFNKSGGVETGIFWIPGPFIGPASIYTAPKRKPCKQHACPDCGRKHAILNLAA